MKTLGLAFGLAAIGFAGCGSDDDAGGNGDVADASPQSDAQTSTPDAAAGGSDAAVIVAESGYVADFDAPSNQDFEEFTGGDWVESTTPSHAEDVRIWYSLDVFDLIATGEPFEASEGGTAIKRRDSSGDGETDVIYVMTKQEAGYDSDNGDWHYEVRSADGTTVTDEGALAACIGCHGSGSGADFDYLRGLDLND